MEEVMFKAKGKVIDRDVVIGKTLITHQFDSYIEDPTGTDLIEVFNNTISLFTGIYDNTKVEKDNLNNNIYKGKPIFENDVISFEHNSIAYSGIVRYIQKEARYRVRGFAFDEITNIKLTDDIYNQRYISMFNKNILFFKGKKEDSLKEFIIGDSLLQYEDTKIGVRINHINHYTNIKPDSLGLFIGIYDNTKKIDLTDKEKTLYHYFLIRSKWKGKPIFEHDIISFKYNNIEMYGVVKYDYNKAAFTVNNYTFNMIDDIKIIGNINFLR